MKDIPQIGFGTYKLNYEETYEMVLHALRIGYRHIDTASLYKNEEAVGRALHDCGIPLAEIYITTKICYKDIARKKVRQGFLTSLEKLGKIDLILLHCPEPGWEDAWEELIKIKKEGFVRHIGVSNFSIKQMEKIKEIPYCNQIEITPFFYRKELVEYCDRRGIKVVAHSSLCKGLAFNNPKLIKIAKTHEITPAQLLLYWGICEGFTVLPRTSQIDHLIENFEIMKMNVKIEPLEIMFEEFEQIITHPRYKN